MKKILFTLLAFLMLVSALPLQAQATDDVFVNGRNKEELSKDITDYINEHLDTTAGVSLAVFTADEILNETYFGSIDKEQKLPVNEESVMEWGSATKLFTWVSVMQLWEQGRIELDRDITEYLPEEFKLHLKYPVTMTHLMNHTAGFQELLVGLMVSDESSISDLKESLMKYEPKQIFQPGEITAYSNYGVALAAYVVECITNTPFCDYVHTNIFEPLGMEHTGFNADMSDAPEVKEQWSRLRHYDITGSPLPYPTLYIPLYPAGMAVGTLKDMITFAQALLPGEGNNLLFQNPNTLTEFYQPTSLYANGSERNCHGMWVEEFVIKTIGHGGNTAGCSSYILIQPETGIGSVVQTNQAQETVYNVDLMSHFFGNKKISDADFQPIDISGVYLQGRTVKRGIMKIYSLLTTIPVMKSGSHYTIPIMSATLEQTAPYEFHIQGESLDERFIYHTLNGKTILQNSVTDLYRMSPLEYIPIILTVLLFILSLVIGLVQLILDLIRKIRRKNKKPLAVIRNLTNASFLICLANILIMLVTGLMFSATMLTICIHAVISLLCLVTACIYLVRMILLLIRSKQKAIPGVTKAGKIGYIVTAVTSVCVIIFVFYWQLFMFS